MFLKLIYLIFIITSATSIHADYWDERRLFIQNEESMAIGSNIILNEKEEIVNKILMVAKHNLKNSSSGGHLQLSKEEINKSEVFKILRRMPKGAALNLHDLSISSIDFLLFNITYRDHLYICTHEDDIKFKFAAFDPNENCWKSVKTSREEERFVEDFDDWLRSKLSLDKENLDEVYKDKVLKITEIIKSLVLYRPVFFDFIYNALEDLYKDNVIYIELQGFLPNLYDLNGTVYNSWETLQILKQINDKFKMDHPDFIGFKYIYASKTNSTMKQNLQEFEEMKQIYPNFLGGMKIYHKDEPLKTVIDQLFLVSDTIKFFYHSDNEMITNIIDAILLNTTRIGYSNELFLHPLVLEEIKRRQIAIEVCPISSQFSNLLKGSSEGYLFASGYPVVISSCDSYFWDRVGLSYDYFDAFMGIATEHADLKMLKQLFLNSLLHSSMTVEEKSHALLTWQFTWDLFLDDFVMDYNYVK